MKINTREKLQILMFGLNAGRNLRVHYHSSRILSDGTIYPLFSNDEIHFTLTLEDQTLGSNIDDTDEESDMYTAIGCLTCSIDEANELYSKMQKAKRNLQ
mgnify:FL=1